MTEIVIFEAMVTMNCATSMQVQNAEIRRTCAFPVREANYVCSENSGLLKLCQISSDLLVVVFISYQLQ